MKADLKDVTFIISFFADSDQRVENLFCILKFINTNFDTNIILVEEDEHSCPMLNDIKGVRYIFIPRCIKDIFYRTKVINTGIHYSTTPYIAIYDADTFFDPKNILIAVEMLRLGQAQMAYSYCGDFVDIDRSYLTDGIIKEQVSFTKDSVGGAVFLDRKAYIEAGMECESVIGWGYDDRERYNRMITLGYSVARTEGKCWHINHSRGINSCNENPYEKANGVVYERMKAMNKMELLDEIKNWAWAKQ